MLAVILACALLIVVGRPLVHLVSTAWQDTGELEETPAGYVDDASRLNQTEVAQVWRIPVDHDDAEGQLAQLLRRASSEGKRVSIAGARHSMGGHTIYPNGIVLDMLSWNGMKLEEQGDRLWVQAGATWRDVIEYLDQRGRSVSVMQSNNSFSVGGSISVNCHGWQFDRPPIASTVESFRLMKADGTIVQCSREENQELFSLALGGYGLFGVILDVQLRVVPNERYRLEQHLVPIEDALATFDGKIRNDPDAAMVYARMNIVPDQLMRQVIINTFLRDPNGEIPGLTEPTAERLRRAIFRGSAESDYGKELRWSAETKLQPLLNSRYFSRNQLLNEGVEVFQNRSTESTDILHEYFVPRHRVADFLERMRDVILRRGANLLNVTVRDVKEDTDTFLRYADQRMIACVMLFVQQRSREGEREMQLLTRELIDAAIQHEGRYYLPYRLHASEEQFHLAYPQADEFFYRKLVYDPEEIFQNQFYAKYARASQRNSAREKDDELQQSERTE